ncbi:MAG: OmpA family protein [Nitrospinae bacterium]|nr:OmpA family protein [Nitrospinota bacterium]
MKTSRTLFGLSAAAWKAFAAGAHAQSIPTEKEIIRALSPRAGGGFAKTRSFKGARGVKVSGAAKAAPSIDLKVSFAFDSAKLDNESLLTLDVLGRALASPVLKGQRIEIVGHTDAKGTAEYNEALSQRRAAAVVSYIVQNFKLDDSLISSKGMGEREPLDKDNPESAANRRVEIRNITQTP